MSRTSTAFKRLGVAAIAVATIGAGVPALVAGAAQAAGGPATQLTITPSTQSAPANTCLTYTVVAKDATGQNPSDTPTLTITLSQQNPTAGTIGFCDPAAAGTPVAVNPASGTAPTTLNTAGTKATTTRDYATKADANGVVSATFGVVSSDANTLNIRAARTDNPAIQSNVATAVYSAGGNEAARGITDATTGSTVTVAGGQQPFTLKVVDGNGAALPGVTVSYQYTSGANQQTPASTTAPYPTCNGQTDNNGLIACNVPVAKAGTDTFTFFVNQVTRNSAQSTGPDAGEPQVQITRTTYPTPSPASAANNVTISPKNTSTTAGAQRDFLIQVTDNKGTAVSGATVTVTIDNGPGRFTGNGANAGVGTRFIQVATNGLGQATVSTITFTSETGTQVVTADISPNNGTGTNTCNSAATTTTAAGNCRDSASNVITTASASPSTSPSTSPSSSTAPAGRQTLGLTIDTPTIEAGNQATLTVTGSANQDIQLECYTRPSTTFAPSHATTIDAAGDAKVFKLSLGMNTRCFAEYVKNPGSGFSNQGVVNVRTVVSIFPVRNGFRDYTFQGHNLPKYAGQLITLYYESKNGTTRKGNVKTDATGIYHIPAKFVGSGTFTFYVRTGQTLTNAAGESDHVSVSIH